MYTSLLGRYRGIHLLCSTRVSINRNLQQHIHSKIFMKAFVLMFTKCKLKQLGYIDLNDYHAEEKKNSKIILTSEL